MKKQISVCIFIYLYQMKLQYPKEIHITEEVRSRWDGRMNGLLSNGMTTLNEGMSCPLRQKWISCSSADQKINFLMFGMELKVVRAVFLPKPSPGSPRLRLGPDVPYLDSFVARSGLT